MLLIFLYGYHHQGGLWLTHLLTLKNLSHPHTKQICRNYNQVLVAWNLNNLFYHITPSKGAKFSKVFLNQATSCHLHKKQNLSILGANSIGLWPFQLRPTLVFLLPPVKSPASLVCPVSLLNRLSLFDSTPAVLSCLRIWFTSKLLSSSTQAFEIQSRFSPLNKLPEQCLLPNCHPC